MKIVALKLFKHTIIFQNRIYVRAQLSSGLLFLGHGDMQCSCSAVEQMCCMKIKMGTQSYQMNPHFWQVVDENCGIEVFRKISFAKTDKRHLGVDLNMPPCESGVYLFLQNSVKFYILVIDGFCQKNILTLKNRQYKPQGGVKSSILGWPLSVLQMNSSYSILFQNRIYVRAQHSSALLFLGHAVQLLSYGTNVLRKIKMGTWSKSREASRAITDILTLDNL